MTDDKADPVLSQEQLQDITRMLNHFMKQGEFGWSLVVLKKDRLSPVVLANIATAGSMMLMEMAKGALIMSQIMGVDSEEFKIDKGH